MLGWFTAFGDVEPLLLVTNDAAGDILFGWQRKPLGKLGKKEGNAGQSAHEVFGLRGHLWGSEKGGKLVFPESWTQQYIIDAVHQTIENPEKYLIVDEHERHVRKTINGVLVEAIWTVDGHTASLKTAYPIRGKGVMQVKGGKLVELKCPRFCSV